MLLFYFLFSELDFVSNGSMLSKPTVILKYICGHIASKLDPLNFHQVEWLT